MTLPIILAIIVAILTTLKLSIELGEKVYVYYKKIQETKKESIPPQIPTRHISLFGDIGPAGLNKKKLLAN